MIHLRLSRRTLRGAGLALGVVAFLLTCYFLGDHLTPRDGTGRPLILSPSVYAMEGYRRAALRWVAEMAEVDRRLISLLAQEGGADPARLYALGREVQDLVDRAATVGRDAALTPPPPALAGLAEQAQAA